MEKKLLLCGVFMFCSVIIIFAQTESGVFGVKETIPSSLKGDIYFIPENTSSLPDFSKLKPVGSVYTKSLDITPRSFESGFPGVTDRTEWFAIRYTGAFSVEKAGDYSFRLHSDDGSKLFIDDKLVIDNDGIHAPQSQIGSVSLQSGIHTIRVEYFQGPRYDIALQLFVTMPGKGEELLVADAETKVVSQTVDMSAGSDFGLVDPIQGGFKGFVYYISQNITKLPDFSTMKSVGAIYTKKLDISPRRFDSGFPGVGDRNEWFAIRYEGAFMIALPGEYTFRILSDDGSKVYVDGQLIIDNDGIHAPQEKTAGVRLAPGRHTIWVEYFQGPRYDVALQLWIKPPRGKEIIFESR